MNLQDFKFPEISQIDMAFSTLRTDKTLLAEAKERGFYEKNTPYNKLFSNLFFSGGTVKFKKNVDKDYLTRVWNYCRAFMKSFEPKHEDKEAISAMLMSEILEPELEKKQSA